mmetsp:Transcript_20716/g.32424  ORF Transcript_20716/g.32424 Transcript_20716/m.32424 type:complete len:295 (-) Transcript_20716:635-1519(-)
MSSIALASISDDVSSDLLLLVLLFERCTENLGRDVDLARTCTADLFCTVSLAVFFALLLMLPCNDFPSTMGVGETERSIGGDFLFDSALFLNVGFLVAVFGRACEGVSSPLALLARLPCNDARLGLFPPTLVAPPLLLVAVPHSSATTASIFLSLLRSFCASSFRISRRSRSFIRSSCIFSNCSSLAFRSAAFSDVVVVVASGVVVAVVGVLAVAELMTWLRVCNADGSLLAPLRRKGFFVGRLVGSSLDTCLSFLLLVLLAAAPIFICLSPNSIMLSNDLSLLLLLSRMCLFI